MGRPLPFVGRKVPFEPTDPTRGLFIMMLFMKPDYIEMLWKDPIGQKMSMGAIILVLEALFIV